MSYIQIVRQIQSSEIQLYTYVYRYTLRKAIHQYVN